MPNKRAVMKEFGVLLEKLITQPLFERFGFTALQPGRGDEGALVEGDEGCGQELTQAGSGRLLVVEWRQADNAVFVGEGFQPIRAKGGTIGKATAGLARPAVTEQASHGDVQGLLCAFWMTVE
ncbi:MAG: hypothetical protein K0B01_09710 [Syntrophobacterales bacterium]|nr:hypothetical protein [Syntrophobacterales bacterium]